MLHFPISYVDVFSFVFRFQRRKVSYFTHAYLEVAFSDFKLYVNFFVFLTIAIFLN